jgi:drug/metabolite transporter (DMT)-like permease
VEVSLSLVAAFFYGAADFFGGFAAKRAPAIPVSALSRSVGLALLAVALPFVSGHPAAADFFWGALAGVCGGLGVALLYHALSIGKMGVVSPVTAVLAASVPVIVSIAFGQKLGLQQLAGIGLALIAIVLISLSFENGAREFSTRGLKEAVASGIALGGFYLFLAHTQRQSGLYAVFASSAASVVFLTLIGLVTRADWRPARDALPMILLSGSLDMAANVLYVLATFNGALAIAAVLTSLYPASTVFLARVVLRERLGTVQWFGVVFALAGVALIALRR